MHRACLNHDDYHTATYESQLERVMDGSAGGELGIGRVRLRLEVRDYVTSFKPLDGKGAAGTRNDVVMAGLRFVKRSTGARGESPADPNGAFQPG